MNKQFQKLSNSNIALSQVFAILLKRYGFYMFNRWMRNKGFRMEYVLYIHKVAARMA